MEFKDYYKTLGVPKSATEKDIKKAYRRLAREKHPDMHPGDKEAERQFQEINEAYEVLSNEENRKKYDQLGANWRQGSTRTRRGPTQSGEVQFDFSDLFGGGGSGGEGASFFERFFGGGGRKGPAAQAPTQQVEVEISLSEAFQGTTRHLEMNTPQACPSCRGAGVVGSGICPGCRGAGRQNGTRKLEVRIPKGVTEGSKVKAQEFSILIHLKPDPNFEVKGRDLIRKVNVDLYDAVLGSEVRFDTPLGKEVSLKIPAESQNGRSFRLSGQGLPGAGGKTAGDLYVKLEVTLPTRLSEEERGLFEKLAQLRKR